LTEIFQGRDANGVFREGTNEVEKTVFIKSPRSVRYGDVVKVIDAVKMAGAQPIGLQIDDLQQ
jgi:biopolymer transport protein ExbD